MVSLAPVVFGAALGLALLGTAIVLGDCKRAAARTGSSGLRSFDPGVPPEGQGPAGARGPGRLSVQLGLSLTTRETMVAFVELRIGLAEESRPGGRFPDFLRAIGPSVRRIGVLPPAARWAPPECPPTGGTFPRSGRASRTVR
jgi:hypothetical protein